MFIEDYIGENISDLLRNDRFKNWPVKKTTTVDAGEPFVHYFFEENGLDVRCDTNDTINTIFLYISDYGGFDVSLTSSQYLLGRKAVLHHFGTPLKSGEGVSVPDLGEYGPWDSFNLVNYIVRFEYHCNSEGVKMVTFSQIDSLA